MRRSPPDAEPMAHAASGAPRAVGWIGTGVGVSLWIAVAASVLLRSHPTAALALASLFAGAVTTTVLSAPRASRSTNGGLRAALLLAGHGFVAAAAAATLHALGHDDAIVAILGVPPWTAPAALFAAAAAAALVERARSRSPRTRG